MGVRRRLAAAQRRPRTVSPPRRFGCRAPRAFRSSERPPPAGAAGGARGASRAGWAAGRRRRAAGALPCSSRAGAAMGPEASRTRGQHPDAPLTPAAAARRRRRAERRWEAGAAAAQGCGRATAPRPRAPLPAAAPRCTPTTRDSRSFRLLPTAPRCCLPEHPSGRSRLFPTRALRLACRAPGAGSRPLFNQVRRAAARRMRHHLPRRRRGARRGRALRFSCDALLGGGAGAHGPRRAGGARPIAVLCGSAAHAADASGGARAQRDPPPGRRRRGIGARRRPAGAATAPAARVDGPAAALGPLQLEAAGGRRAPRASAAGKGWAPAAPRAAAFPTLGLGARRRPLSPPSASQEQT